MWKPERIVSWFGLSGFLIGMGLYVYSSLFNYSKPLTDLDMFVGIVTFMLCPPTLLFVLCIDCEVGGVDGAITFLLISLMNAALYSAIGFAVLKLRKQKV